MTSAYAEVIGDPIAQSKSPLIHNFWLGKLGIDADYRATRIAAGDLESFLSDRRGDSAWRGCNVTMPLKLVAAAAADTSAPGIARIGAANVLVRQGDQLIADNTDAVGILDVLPETLMPASARVCLIGTGGAARAALAALSRRGVPRVALAARSLDAGRALMADFGFDGPVAPLEHREAIVDADVIINATPLGMRGQAPVPAVLLAALDACDTGMVVFDMIYDPVVTPLLERARARGLRTADGLEMLVGQAAAAFAMFFGHPAPRQHDAELRALLLA